MKSRKRFIQCSHIGKRSNEAQWLSSSPVLGPWQWGLCLNRKQMVCITKQSWSNCGPAHFTASAVRPSGKVSDCVKLLSCRQVPPLIGTRASLFSFFPQHAIPGEIPQVHYFNILTAKGRGTHVSLDDLRPCQDSHSALWFWVLISSSSQYCLHLTCPLWSETLQTIKIWVNHVRNSLTQLHSEDVHFLLLDNKTECNNLNSV